IVGPRPSSFTVSTLANSAAPAQNSFSCSAVKPVIGLVTSVHVKPPTRPKLVTGRGPGSRTAVWVKPTVIEVVSITETKADLMTSLRARNVTVTLPLLRHVDHTRTSGVYSSN